MVIYAAKRWFFFSYLILKENKRFFVSLQWCWGKMWVACWSEMILMCWEILEMQRE